MSILFIYLNMNDFPIYFTGIRSGDTIVDVNGSKQNKGSILKVTFNNTSYPPSRDALATLNKDQWKNLIEYVKKASPSLLVETDEHVKMWLLDNSTEYDDLYISDTQSILQSQKTKIDKEDILFSYTPPTIQINSLGGTIFTDTIRDQFIGTSSILLSDLYNAIPVKKIGTHARRHSLVFRPNIWKLKIPDDINLTYNGYVFDMDTYEFYKDNIHQKQLIVLPFGLGVAYSTKEPTLPTLDDIFKVIIRVLNNDSTTIEELNSIRDALSFFTPSVHKSLIQKIIRRNTPIVIGPTPHKWRADTVLLVSFAMLLVQPGAFIPDLQIYVSGLESAAKRLAVSINEDSYVEDAPGLLSLYLGALISKPRGNWYPSLLLIENWMKLALYSHSSNNTYIYDLHAKYVSRNSDTLENIQSNYDVTKPYDACFLALKELRSFETDIRMLNQISDNNGAYINPYKPSGINGTDMHLVRSIDHHNHTDLFYMLDPSWSELVKQYGTISYSPLIKILWDNISGINPRHGERIDNSNDIIRAFTLAQWRLYRMNTRTPVLRQIKDGESYIVENMIKDSQLAGMIGSHEIKVGKKILLVSLDSTDIANRILMVRPTRDKHDFTISDSERISAIKLFHTLLMSGITVNIPKGLAWLYPNHSKLKISFNEEFIVNDIPWSQVKTYDIKLPINRTLTWDPMFKELDAAIATTGDGIEQNGLDIIDILDELSIDILRRIMNYLRGIRSNIIMPSIGRDGYGTEYSVDPIDVAVYHFFIKLSIRMPGVIAVYSTKEFKIKNSIVMNLISNKIRSYIRTKTGSSNVAWIPVNLPRQLFPHQLEARDEILSRMDTQDIHMIDMPVGSGKTSVVADIIRILIENNNMPRYVVYSLPPSSFDNIMREFRLYGYKVVHLDPRKKTPIVLEDSTIHLIHHDHMRFTNIINVLRTNAVNTFFVVDEFHLTLNHTQRTSIALELARLSYYTITMSGTPIKDNRIDLLIPWLEMIVDFEVTSHNFWVAMSSMVRRHIDLHITVNYNELEATMTREEESNYLTLLGEHVRAQESNFRNAVNIAYRACDRTMISLANEYLDNNRLVFIVARNINHQSILRDMLIETGLKDENIHILSSKNSITYTPEIAKYKSIKVIITTLHHSTGYTLTAMSVLITSVYYSNESTRSQLVGRIVRIGQPRDNVDVITVHAGILTNIMQRYNEARNMSLALKAVAKDIGLPIAHKLSRVLD